MMTCSLVTTGRLTLENSNGDEDNDDKTCERGQTIAILKPRFSLWIICAYNCKGDILQLEEDISRQKKDEPNGSMFSICFTNLKMYMEKLTCSQ